MAKELTRAVDDCVVVVHASDIEAHNALGMGDHYHHPLRRVYVPVFKTDYAIEAPLTLRLAVKALNYQMGPGGLVQSLLVVGPLPGFTNPRGSVQRNVRLTTMAAAKEEADCIT